MVNIGEYTKSYPTKNRPSLTELREYRILAIDGIVSDEAFEASSNEVAPVAWYDE